MAVRMQVSVIAWMLIVLFSTVSSRAETLFKLDFSNQKEGSAQGWFEKNNFKLQNDADEIKARFENGRLVLEADDEMTGLFSKSLKLEGASTIRIEWGVDQYPKGADWERGKFREAIAVIISFGDKKISSGSFVVPDVPYFIGLFLGERETEGKVYLGNYFKKGGRYFCTSCGTPTGQLVVTEFNLSETFKREFGESKVPFISSISIEIDTRDTEGHSKAFIQSVSFHSP